MSPRHFTRRAMALTAAAVLLTSAPPVHAHDFRAGDLVIDHPYATPSIPGTTNGAVYFRSIKNQGRSSDRLIAARTELAARVELHEMRMDGDVMRMREVAAIDLPAGADVQLRHGQSHHLMLIDLKQPLVVGDRFDITLVFEKAGAKTVKVWVQQPRGGSAEQHQH